MDRLNRPVSFIHEDDHEESEFVEYLHHTTQKLWNVCPPILLVLGTLGNGLSVAVLSHKAMKQSNASIYLIVLSVVDVFALYVGLLRQWLRFGFSIDIRNFGPWQCKVS